MDVVWEDPPERRQGRKDGMTLWQRRLLPLLERPGAWARVYEYGTKQQAYSASTGLRIGRLQIPDGKWEFTSRDGAVYARYVGPE